jgi:hypothetical protein
MQSRVFVFIAAFILNSFTMQTLACGESLYRVGRGVAYRNYTAPLPGNLLVFATTESAEKIAQRLKESGHDVQLVHDVDELKSAINTGQYDMIIGPANQGANIDSPTPFLPVTSNRQEKRQARKAYGQALDEKDGVRDYLRIIHRSLKEQKS